MWVLVACADGPRAPACAPDGPHLLVATTDFSSGALAAVATDGSCVADAIASAGPDPLVRWLEDRAVVADRTGGNAIRTYLPGAYSAPEREFAVDVGGNVHDVAQVGDTLLISLFDRAEVVATDLDGAEIGRVDLAAHADADGLPEADRFGIADGRLLLAVQRLARTGSTWPPAGEGRVLEIATDALEVAAAWDAGTDPKLALDLVLTGVFFEPDGALHGFDAGLGPPVATEAALGYDLSGVAAVGDHAVVLGLGFPRGDGTYGPQHVDCVDLRDGAVTPGLETGAWPVDLAAGDGAVYVALRASWSEAGANAVLRVDPVTCAVETLAEAFLLEPFALAHIP